MLLNNSTSYSLLCQYRYTNAALCYNFGIIHTVHYIHISNFFIQPFKGTIQLATLHLLMCVTYLAELCIKVLVEKNIANGVL